jgi:serine phosphatase RsbU (regulator of sigma subunit)
LYAGLNRGLKKLPPYQLDIEDDHHRFDSFMSHKILSVHTCVFKNQLIISSKSGLFQVKNDTLNKIGDYPGGCMGQSAAFPNTLFMAGEPLGFLAWELDLKEDESIRMKRVLSMGQYSAVLGGIIRKIVSDDQGNLWLSTQTDGIVHVRFENHSLESPQVFVYNTLHGLPKPIWNQVHWIDGKLLIGTLEGIYHIAGKGKKTNDLQNLCFEPDPLFEKTINRFKMRVHFIQPDRNNDMWITHFESGFSWLKKQTDGSFSLIQAPFKKISGYIETILAEDDGVIWLGANDALYRFDSTINKNYQQPFEALITRLQLRTGEFLSLCNDLQLPFSNNNLIFNCATPFFENSDRNQFQYQLTGFETDWGDWSVNHQKEYTNLHEGNYVFQVQAKNIFGHASKIATLHFSISPPWYRTFIAFTGYVLLFFVLIYFGIRFNTRRLIAAKQRLENIITERTAEVRQQKEEIEHHADNLYKTNLQLAEARNALWGEMELAKKIQTVLLPKEPYIPGYEIAAYMKPADEVGGDYYDVICIDNNDCRGGSCARPPNSGQSQGADPQHPNMGNHKGLPLLGLRPQDSLTTIHQPFIPTGDLSLHSPTTAPEPSYWLSIGDVSGHGVPAGLVMMMVQTSIRSIIHKAPLDSVNKILIAVNQVIYENIKKLGEDKYMTITLMSLQSDGNIFYSGLHQDIILYRADTKKTERIETKGMWIGMTNDISEMIQVDQLVLKPSDMILLYTDGITEAIDSAGMMFSEEKLMALFTQLATLEPEEIKNGILRELGGYTCNDDITIMVIKKM